ncbi:MAG: fibronectin type III domain-containing protein [Candidatus Schekmanbacteria bacterium]|nr:fibronectin type III domain-containing protein [Candidatus Schekmanbacteria bacterium]
MSVTTSAALIDIAANEPVTLRVDYGQSGQSLQRQAIVGRLATELQLLLDGLDSPRAHDFQVTPTDRWGNEGSPLTASCSTLAASPPGSLRIVSGPVSGAQRRETASGRATVGIEWMTDFPASSTLLWELLPSGGQNVSPRADPANLLEFPGLGRVHRVFLTGAEPGKTYRLVARSTDLFGRTASLEDLRVSVPAQSASGPLGFVNAGQVTYLSDKTVIIEWETDRLAQSEVSVREVSSARRGSEKRTFFSVKGPSLRNQIAIKLADLGGTGKSPTYELRIRARTAGGSVAQAAPSQSTFTPATAPDAEPPTVSGIRIVPVSTAVAFLSWTTSEPTSSAVEHGEGALGSKIVDSDYLTEHAVHLSGLNEGGLVSYRITATDPAGNSTTSQSGNVQLSTTPDTTPPQIVGQPSVKVQGDKLLVEWQTDEPSDSIVHVGSKPGVMEDYYHDGTDVTAHVMCLGGLPIGQSLYLQLESADFEGNPSERMEVGPELIPVPFGGTAGGAGHATGNCLPTPREHEERSAIAGPPGLRVPREGRLLSWRLRGRMVRRRMA